MPNYRRLFVPGGTYYFTVVSHLRRRIFTHPAVREILRDAFQETKQDRPFRIDAIVLLPDHFHCVWTLPPGDADYPTRWREIKTTFTQHYLDAGFSEGPLSASRRRKGERGVWQRRYYEHRVRDADDLKHCVDYIDFNPVKHRVVEMVRDWPWSSFHRYVQLGEYPINWGGSPNLYGDEWLR